MNLNGNQLLSALGSGIIPAATGEGSAASSIRHTEGLRFDEVLARITRDGQSKIGIQFGKGVLPGSLSIEQQEQVGQAADMAVLQGIRNAVVDLGDSIVRLDVPNRVLEAQFEPGEAGVIDRIDGFVSMRSSSKSGSAESIPQPHAAIVPARIVRNASLADVLSAHDP